MDSNQRTLNRLQRRLDQEAIVQLRAEVARLSDLLERSESARLRAEEEADSSFEYAMEMAERLAEMSSNEGGRSMVGITKSGRPVVVAEQSEA